MSRRWTLKEDYIVCDFCQKNRSKGLDTVIDELVSALEERGCNSRSKSAILRRAREYDKLFGGYEGSDITKQVLNTFEDLPRRIEMYRWVDSYVAEHYSPNSLIEPEESETIGVSNNLSQYLDIEPIEVKESFYMVFNDLLDKYYEKHKTDNKTRGKVKKEFRDSLTINYCVEGNTFDAIRRAKYKSVSRTILFRLFFALELEYWEAKMLLESLGLDFEGDEKFDQCIAGILKCKSSRRFIPWEIDDTLKRNAGKTLFTQL